MNPELEKYIDMALIDGVITESEKSFLIKKANQLGIDEDEFEFVLNAKVQMKQKELHQSAPPPPSPQNVVASPDVKIKSQKEGDIKKCPSCGAPADSFSTKCTDCGHEFRNIETSFTAEKLHNEFTKMESESREEYYRKGLDKDVFPASGLMRKETVLQKDSNQIEDDIEAIIAEKKIRLVSSFPIPNTKEDILEILSIGVPEAKKKISFWDKVGASKSKVKKAWLAKCEQVIIKSRFSMKNDKKTLHEIEQYAKQLKIK
jgi:hypothetical protein